MFGIENDTISGIFLRLALKQSVFAVSFTCDWMPKCECKKYNFSIVSVHFPSFLIIDQSSAIWLIANGMHLLVWCALASSRVGKNHCFRNVEPKQKNLAPSKSIILALISVHFTSLVDKDETPTTWFSQKEVDWLVRGAESSPRARKASVSEMLCRNKKI